MSDDPRREPDEKATQKRPATHPAMEAVQAPTTRIEALTDRKLLEMLVGNVKDATTKLDLVNDKVDTLAINVEILQDDGRDTKTRLTRIEGWKEDVDTRLSNNSQRARGASQVDATMAAELVKEREAREELAKKVDENTALTKTVVSDLKVNTKATVDISQRLYEAAGGFFKRNPKIETALVAFLILIIGAAGMAIQALVKHL